MHKRAQRGVLPLLILLLMLSGCRSVRSLMIIQQAQKAWNATGSAELKVQLQLMGTASASGIEVQLETTAEGTIAWQKEPLRMHGQLTAQVKAGPLRVPVPIEFTVSDDQNQLRLAQKIGPVWVTISNAAPEQDFDLISSFSLAGSRVLQETADIAGQSCTVLSQTMKGDVLAAWLKLMETEDTPSLDFSALETMQLEVLRYVDQSGRPVRLRLYAESQEKTSPDGQPAAALQTLELILDFSNRNETAVDLSEIQ